MSDQIPPPGPERDAEIAKLLGWPAAHEWPDPDPKAAWIGDQICQICGMRDHSWFKGKPCEPAFSVDPGPCDRLVEEMVRRGWWVTVESQPNGKIFASVHRGYDYDVMIDAQTANGTTRPDAVSAAALLALRGGA